MWMSFASFSSVASSIFSLYFLKPEFPNDRFKMITEDLGIPLGVYRRVPDFLVQKFENLKAEL